MTTQSSKVLSSKKETVSKGKQERKEERKNKKQTGNKMYFDDS